MVHTVAYVCCVGDLTRDDWARAAALAWGEKGFRAVSVEPLAKALQVTKGSFYWHFKSKAELIGAVVEFWEAQGTEAVIARLEAVECPRERLVALFREAWDRLEFLKTEAAIGAVALTGHEQVAPAYERVQLRRLNYVAGLYEGLGYTRAEARRRAVVAYGAFLGSVQIVLLGDESLRTPAGLRRQLKLFEEMLIP